MLKTIRPRLRCAILGHSWVDDSTDFDSASRRDCTCCNAAESRVAMRWIPDGGIVAELVADMSRRYAEEVDMLRSALRDREEQLKQAAARLRSLEIPEDF